MPLSWWKLFGGTVASRQTTKLNYCGTLLQSNLDYPDFNYPNTSALSDYLNPQLSESFYLVPAYMK